jgi:signal peptidase I
VKRHAIKNDSITEVDDSEVDYEVTSPNKFFGSHLNLIPLQSSVHGSRLFYGSKFINQALPVLKPEAPLVQNLDDDDEKGRSFDEVFGRNAGAIFADKNGVVQSVDKKTVTIRNEDGTLDKKSLYHNFPFNRKTSLHNTPMVRKGAAVRAGDLVAKSNYTDDKGTLALGLNARVGLLPYKGHSFEDAMVVSEDMAARLTSEHMYSDDIEYKRGLKGGKGHFVSLFPKKYKTAQLDKLDGDGVALPGQILEPGDPIALGTKPRVVSSASQKLGKLSSHMKNSRNESSLTWGHENPGVVTDVVRTRNGVKVTVKSSEPAMPGDKVVFRSGQKGTISKIVPRDHMPRTVDGKPLEMLLNPLGIPSRVNNSMVYELLLGKAAKAAGKPYKVNSFTKKGEKWFDIVKAELDKYGISDVEEVFDPQTDKKLESAATVGDAHVLKLHHTATKGFSARNQGAYDINEQPLKGGSAEAQSKRLSGLETHGLISSGAYGVLKDMSLVRGAKNDDYWQQLRSGYDPKMPDTPLVFNKFKTLLQGSGYHARQINKKGGLRLGPMTEKVLDELQPVEIANPGILDMRKLGKGSVVPVAGGLFDDSLATTNKYGYIKLPFEVPNPAFEEPVRKILGLTEKQFRAIMAGKEELPPELVKRMQKYVKKASTDVPKLQHTGPEALGAALRTFSSQDVENIARDGLKTNKKSTRGTSVKMMRYAAGLKTNKLEPSDYLINRVPVIPPKFRPFNIIGDSFVPGDANELYKDLFEVRDSHNELVSELGEEATGDSKMNVYDSVKAVYGYGDPVQPKTKSRGVSGFLNKLIGNTAKFGFFQRKLISKPVDSSGRGVIGVDPELDLDQVGIPEDMAWKLYAPYIQRRLVRAGRTPGDAVMAIRDKAEHARHAMDLEAKERPVIYSRSPAWHRYNVVAGYPKIIDGNTVMISPLVTNGHNADFDGDAMNVQLPSLPEAVDDAKNKLLPSKMLFSIKKRGDVVPVPTQEFILGLYTSQKSKPQARYRFNSREEALRAIKSGKVKLSDDIVIG